MIRIVKTPFPFIYLMPSMVWRIPEKENIIYLTFDDGPTRVSTPIILNILSQYKARATFFCVGDNIKKFPSIFRSVVDQGHFIGNHTFNHLNGWKTEKDLYFENIKKCNDAISETGYVTEKLLFRPPYGRLTYAQIKTLSKNYRIIMWDILTMDFNPGKYPDRLLKRILARTGKGSIVVFHDSERAFPTTRLFLESFLHYFTEKGYSFKTLQHLS